MSFLMRPVTRVVRQRTPALLCPRNCTQQNQPPKTTPQPPPPVHHKSHKIFYLGVAAGLAGGYYYLVKNDMCPIMNKYFNKCDSVRKVADIDPAAYKLEVKIDSNKLSTTFNFDDIKALPKHSMKTTLTCEGNALKNKIISMDESEWTGAKLSDILTNMGVNAKQNREVVLKGADADAAGAEGQKAHLFTMPVAKALDKENVVLIAYLKNGKPLEHTNGYPVIALVHGEKGARKVKWLTQIVVNEN